MPKSKKASKTNSTFDLDGRTLEGGGQLLRLAVGLSALTGQPLSMSHIRGNRHGGGLKAQHLACVKWLAEACDAEIEGAALKSQNLVFRPGVAPGVWPPTYTPRDEAAQPHVFDARIDIGSPGSIALALQAVLPFILFSPPGGRGEEDKDSCVVKLVITGGTNVTNSPSYEYLAQVLFPTLAKIGLPPIESSLDARGWSTGRSCIGSATFIIPTLRTGSQLPAVVLRPPDQAEDSRTEPSRIVATVIAPEALWEHFRDAISTELRRTFPLDEAEIAITLEDSGHHKQIYLILVASVMHGDQEHKLGSDELFQGKNVGTSEQMTRGMVRRITANLAEDIRSNACVDRHMSDQLVVFQALAAGKSNVWRGTDDMGQALGQSLHAETAEWITTAMLGAQPKHGRGRGVGFAAVGRQDRAGAP